MTQETATSYHVTHTIHGTTMRDGYVQRTNNMEASIVIIDGVRHARVMDNGDLYACEQWDRSLRDYLLMWDDEYVDAFRSEGLIV